MQQNKPTPEQIQHMTTVHEWTFLEPAQCFTKQFGIFQARIFMKKNGKWAGHFAMKKNFFGFWTIQSDLHYGRIENLESPYYVVEWVKEHSQKVFSEHGNKIIRFNK